MPAMMDIEQIQRRVILYRDRYPRECADFDKARKEVMESATRDQLLLLIENMYFELIQKREVRRQAIAVLMQDIEKE